MGEALKYIINEKGDKTSVLIPVKLWEKINADYATLKNKLEVFSGIQKGLKEVAEAKKNSRSLQTLKDFLSENND